MIPLDISFWIWGLFFILIGGMLALDLGVFQRDNHPITQREAWFWSLVWIAIALLFNGWIHLWYGHEAALDFLTAYLVEKSLSLDNLFVFALIFNYFSTPPKHQHRVLYWGILGAIVMRLALIIFGVKIIHHFEWLLYGMGLFLIYSGVTFFRHFDQTEKNFNENRLLKFAKKKIPLRDNGKQPRFFIRHQGKIHMTPLFLVLLSIEFSDLVFALDSIPAVFGITLDPFLAFTSNVFAILGLRSLYFVLADVLPRFYYLKHALSLILIFVGAKMTIGEVVKISSLLSLSVVGIIITSALVLSLLKKANPVLFSGKTK